jgi:hypothetical protein
LLPGLAEGLVHVFELALGADEDDAAVVETEALGIANIPGDAGAGAGRAYYRHPVNPAALSDDGDPLAGNKSSV